MRKSAKARKQEIENYNVETAMRDCFIEINNTTVKTGKQLRTCNARVYETENYYILRSYNTLVACISKRTNNCYDFLRYIYGYTSTSCQHICKFNSDYGKGEKFTYRAI